MLSEAEAGRNVSLLGADYCKEFDRLGITVAMKHLLDLDVRAECIPWIADFLINRQHRVKLTSGQVSDREATTCGVSL